MNQVFDTPAVAGDDESRGYTRLLNATAADVQTAPFPHVISEQMLPPDLYARLRADYPTAEQFDDQKNDTGLTGSRTGQGFDIYRGDSSYEQLVASSKAWAEFDGWINSSAFVQQFVEVFGPHLQNLDCRADILPEEYQRGLVEGRSGMTAKATLADRFDTLTRFLRKGSSLGAVELFTRLDVHKAMTGYEKVVHCDRPNRLCSLVLYFTDAEKSGIEGGRLSVHGHVDQKAARDYERHPKPEEAPIAATLAPKENLGVWFPCSNNSYHSVTAVTSEGTPRDYLYISISARENIW